MLRQESGSVPEEKIFAWPMFLRRQQRVGQEIQIDVRGKLVGAQIVKTPFYKTRNRIKRKLRSIMANNPDDLHYSKDHEWVSR